MSNRAFFILVLLLAPPAIACSIAPGYEPFVPQAERGPPTAASPPPQIKVESIRRGHAGDSGMCADIGFLSLKVPVEPAGFRFEIVEGNLPVKFPRGFVKSRKPGVIGFIWSDGNSDLQEPIHAVVKITAVSAAGSLSEPLLLQIEDPGVPGR